MIKCGELDKFVNRSGESVQNGRVGKELMMLGINNIII